MLQYYAHLRQSSQYINLPTAEKPKPGDELAPISPELARWIRLRAQDLKLRQSDRQWAVDLVNHLRESLLVFLKSSDEQPYFQSASVLSSGSYYEMVKVTHKMRQDMYLAVGSFKTHEHKRTNYPHFHLRCVLKNMD